jgi:MoxR-like ATPase
MLENIDRRDGHVYVFGSKDDPLQLAVQVALTTDRPLLLRGDPGVGKSSIAAFIARKRNWRYYEHEVTARTEATDLLWTFDAVRKLGDATMLASRGPDAALDDHDYVEPGDLWWAFDQEGARRRGAANGVRRRRLSRCEN